MNKIKYSISIVYILAFFFLYPIAAHILMYKIGYMTDKLPHGKFWVVLQTFLSGPVVIILGIILVTGFRRSILNQVFGTIFIGIGVYWLYLVINSVIKEAA